MTPALPIPGVAEILILLQPYLVRPLPAGTPEKLHAYLELLLRWNARTNLTAVRDPEQIVRLHFGECVFAAQQLLDGLQLPNDQQVVFNVQVTQIKQRPNGPQPPTDPAVSACLKDLLDFGSGAGFPGIPMQLCHPALAVTLAESQGKKAAFLREAVRTLGLPSHVLSARVESLPRTKCFSVVCLRAVDDMATAIKEASRRVAPGGQLVVLTTSQEAESMSQVANWGQFRILAIPESQQRVVLFAALR